MWLSELLDNLDETGFPVVAPGVLVLGIIAGAFTNSGAVLLATLVVGLTYTVVMVWRHRPGHEE